MLKSYLKGKVFLDGAGQVAQVQAAAAHVDRHAGKRTRRAFCGHSPLGILLSHTLRTGFMQQNGFSPSLNPSSLAEVLADHEDLYF